MKHSSYAQIVSVFINEPSVVLATKSGVKFRGAVNDHSLARFSNIARYSTESIIFLMNLISTCCQASSKNSGHRNALLYTSSVDRGSV